MKELKGIERNSGKNNGYNIYRIHKFRSSKKRTIETRKSEEK